MLTDETIQQISTLFEEGKTEEGSKLLADALTATPTGAEAGREKLAMLMTYVNSINSANERYKQTLEEAIAALEAMQKSEGEAHRRLDLGALKNDILS